MLYVSLDPGTSTGVATYKDGIVSLQVFADKFEACDWVESVFAEADGPVQPIIEGFRPRPNVVFIPDSLHIIGTVLYLANKYKTEEVIIQMPAEAKGPFPDKVLRSWGKQWYHKSDHARDAARHLAVTLVKQKVISPRDGCPRSE